MFWTVVAMAQAADLGADSWITNRAQFANGVIISSAARDNFPDLHAELISGSLKVSCKTASNATVYVSADPQGHWAARDWHAYPMTPRDGNYEATVPVLDVDVSMAYFIRVGEQYSPVRLCHPRQLGLSQPSEHLWKFLEGFEEDIAAWHLLSDGPALQRSASARSGRCSLLVTIPAEKRSATISTTLLRGWQLKKHSALGVRFWVRTELGQGQARLCLFENAFTPTQAIQTSPDLVKFGPSWQKVDLYFADFPNLDLAEVDLFTIELIGQGPMEFLIDDMELIAKE